jgi:Cupin domain
LILFRQNGDIEDMKKISNSGFGSFYFKGDQIHESNVDDQYFYRVYSGKHKFKLESGDCCFYLSENFDRALLARGPNLINSSNFAAVIRGYAPPEKSLQLNLQTNLPYINGCSARQLFAPERPGDPTWQLLKMPIGTKEQMHHIHPTARVVYVLKGEGLSVVGTAQRMIKTKLLPGMVCVLDPMCPHHFETDAKELIVLPVHVWSSIPNLDFNHPMFNGTLRAADE